ncbi:condensin-2 complex subunit H2 [Hyperolius riggenbachi]|uniref:condensin-2 complex subunit H2 n=1 Tax=Hyperolius riggenbachi TaxID=752182 RepID=UPI0035A29F33
MEDVESRFTHLLQPIRDLTKNWDVDVASQLEEYLGELEQVCISFDGGKTSMNFVEAAFLIQGSACIYSKKVEYLYSLVYQALDFFSNKKRDQQPTCIGPDGVDRDANFTNEAKEEFLVLDDTPESRNQNIDVKKDQNPNLVNIVHLTPVALIAPEEMVKQTNPLCSRKGEVLASMHDFRINSCAAHTYGSFVLELAMMTPTMFKQSTMRREDASFCPAIPEAELADNENMEVDCRDPVPVLNFSEADAPAINDGGVFLPLADNEEEDCADVDPVEHIERQQNRTEERAYALRQREVKDVPITSVEDNLLDPWRSLNPFDSCSDKFCKPFKKGKYYTMPRGVVDDLSSNKRKRRLPCKLQDFVKWFNAYCGGAEAIKSRRKGPTYADMEALYWKQAKSRIAVHKKLQKRLGAEISRVEDLLAEEDHANHIEEAREDDHLDNQDCADLSDHEDLGQSVPAIFAEEIAREHIEPIDFQDQLSYEELVRKNVELYISNSQKYAQETVLSLRVREWEDKMGPQLQEQEEQGPFDIHDYGDRLASQFSMVGEWRTFASLMAHREPYEVCRYLLASLQLANDYTVEVAQKPGLHESVDTMSLRLLSQQRAHERFKTYKAPSLEH